MARKDDDRHLPHENKLLEIPATFAQMSYGFVSLNNIFGDIYDSVFAPFVNIIITNISILICFLFHNMINYAINVYIRNEYIRGGSKGRWGPPIFIKRGKKCCVCARENAAF